MYNSMFNKKCWWYDHESVGLYTSVTTWKTLNQLVGSFSVSLVQNLKMAYFDLNVYKV